MARLFDDAASEYLETDSAPITATPFTMACWFYSDDVTAAQVLMWVGDKDTTNAYVRISAQGDVAGDPVRFTLAPGGGSLHANTSTGYSADTWHHACAVAATSSDRSVFIDGGSEGTNTTSDFVPGEDRVAIGRTADSTPALYMSGRIAEATIWNIALSNAEVALLAKGVHSLLIQPENIVAYWPLIRDDDRDWVGGFDLTAFNTPSVANHPPKVQSPLLASLWGKSVTAAPPVGNPYYAYVQQ